MYILDFFRSSQKDLKKINKSDQSFTLDSLEDFAKNFSSEYEISLMTTGKIQKLQGQKEEDRLIILVLHVTTRKGAYR